MFRSWVATKTTPEKNPAMHAWAAECVRALEIERASKQAEVAEQAQRLQDLAGSANVAAWRSPHVLALTTAIYEQNAFDLMTTLGAALADAGCRDTSVLKHCSLPNHVKGCFLVDMLLGKE